MRLLTAEECIRVSGGETREERMVRIMEVEAFKAALEVNPTLQGYADCTSGTPNSSGSIEYSCVFTSEVNYDQVNFQYINKSLWFLDPGESLPAAKIGYALALQDRGLHLNEYTGNILQQFQACAVAYNGTATERCSVREFADWMANHWETASTPAPMPMTYFNYQAYYDAQFDAFTNNAMYNAVMTWYPTYFNPFVGMGMGS